MWKLCQKNNNSYRSKCMKYMIICPMVDSYSNYIGKKIMECAKIVTKNSLSLQGCRMFIGRSDA